ncbi:AAA family ATPase [Methylobacterium fujisawaense]|uniref:AAA family ATPase n=1 Tax=Methylobacterium fujisawaense TaxID=107400 RepID=UPI00313EF7D7
MNAHTISHPNNMSLTAIRQGTPTHNREAAQKFLDLLEGGGEFLFALKPDQDGAPWPRGCPAHVYGTLDAVWPYVERFNNETHRVGVFVTINRHPRVTDDGDKLRRGGAHVTDIRAVFIDVDDPGRISEVEAALGQGLMPNATVLTARGRHYYWLIDGLPLDRFKLFQGTLAMRFGSDRAVTDLARIMRLPGTRHVKTGFVPVGCIVSHRSRITADRLMTGFGLSLSETRPERKAAAVTEALPANFSIPARCAVNLPQTSELAAGIAEATLRDAENAAMALALAGRINGRDDWRDLLLFPFTNFALDNPDWEGAAKDAFDRVCAASATKGANTANNEAQWNATMCGAGRVDGARRTVASTIQAAATVMGQAGGTTTAGSVAGAIAPPSPTEAPVAATPALSAFIQLPPPSGLGQAFGGTLTPPPLPRSLRLATAPPHRRWVLGTRLVRSEYAVLAAPGGRAKSSVAIAWACSLASGKNLVGERVHGGPKRVLYISTEDDAVELDRRFYAAMLAHQLTPADLANIQVLGVDTVRLTLTTGADRAPAINPNGLAALQQYIEVARADVVILDPLAPLIPVGLNDNGLIASLMAQVKALTVQGDFALLIIHHFKKGGDGSAEAVGGASAIVNHARAAYTVDAMGEREATAFSVMPSERWRVLRVADLKLNLAPPAGDTDWLHLESVILPNAAPPDYPNGESVQAVTRFKPPSIGMAGAGKLDAADAARIEAEFVRKVQEAQNANRAFYATKQGAKTSGVPAAVNALADVLRSVTKRPPLDCEALAEPMLTALLARGVIVEAQIPTPTRHKRRGFIVGPNAPGEDGR